MPTAAKTTIAVPRIFTRSELAALVTAVTVTATNDLTGVLSGNRQLATSIVTVTVGAAPAVYRYAESYAQSLLAKRAGRKALTPESLAALATDVTTTDTALGSPEVTQPFVGAVQHEAASIIATAPAADRPLAQEVIALADSELASRVTDLKARVADAPSGAVTFPVTFPVRPARADGASLAPQTPATAAATSVISTAPAVTGATTAPAAVTAPTPAKGTTDALGIFHPAE